MKRLLNTIAVAALALTPAIATAQDKVNLEVQYPYAFVFDNVFKELKAAFEKEHPDITVTYRTPYAEYEDGAQTALRNAVAHQLPDVSMQAINFQRLFADRSLAVDLSPSIAQEQNWKERGYSDSMMTLGNFGGKQYGMAFAVSTPIVY